MKIHKPKFKGGTHQFSDEIHNTYHNETTDMAFWKLIPQHLLTKEELNTLSKKLELWIKTEPWEVKWKDAVLDINNMLHGKISLNEENSLNDLLFDSEQEGPIQYDAFLSFCEEDAEIAKKLYKELSKNELKIWFSKVKLNTGDSILGVINKAIQNSKAGIAIISEHTFKDPKHFPLLELNALLNKEMYDNMLVLPVYHNISHEDIVKEGILIADKYAVKTDEGVEKVAKKLIKSLQLFQ